MRREWAAAAAQPPTAPSRVPHALPALCLALCCPFLHLETACEPRRGVPACGRLGGGAGVLACRTTPAQVQVAVQRTLWQCARGAGWGQRGHNSRFFKWPPRRAWDMPCTSRLAFSVGHILGKVEHP